MTTNASPMNKIKVRFQIQQSEGMPFSAETIWAEPAGEGLHILLNSPFFAFNVSAGDVVETKGGEGKIRDFLRVAKRGGHSTYRLYLKGGHTVHGSDFSRLWSQVSDLGGRTKTQTTGLLPWTCRLTQTSLRFTRFLRLVRRRVFGHLRRPTIARR